MLEGKRISLSDDRLRFDSIQSQRFQAGTRLSWRPIERVAAYAGLSYEHEFDGQVKSSLRHDVAVHTPSLRGDTGIAELGLSFKPSKDLPLSFDLGAQGYVGKREGVGGSFQARFEF